MFLTVGETLEDRIVMTVYEEIKGGVLVRILEIYEGKNNLKVKHTALRNGRVIFVYEDEVTAEWLCNVALSLKLRW